MGKETFIAHIKSPQQGHWIVSELEVNRIIWLAKKCKKKQKQNSRIHKFEYWNILLMTFYQTDKILGPVYWYHMC